MRKTSAIAVITLLLILSPASAYASNHIYFEFYNGKTNTITHTIPYNVPYELIVASNIVNIIDLLPIEITYNMEGQITNNTIPNNPQKVCRGPDGCSIPGIEVTNVNPNDPPKIAITAEDKGGAIISTYENEPSIIDEEPPMKPRQESSQFATSAGNLPPDTYEDRNPFDDPWVMFGIYIAGLTLILITLLILTLRGSPTARYRLEQFLRDFPDKFIGKQPKEKD